MKRPQQQSGGFSIRECPAQPELNRSPNNRILIFKESGGEHFIDFVPHAIIAGTLYIVPPFHFHYLSAAYDKPYLNIEVPTYSGYSKAQYFVNTLRYRQEKALHRERAQQQYTYSRWSEKVDDPLSLLQQDMTDANRHADAETIPDTQLEYAEMFANSLADARITWLSLGRQTQVVPVHERTLRRACRSVYGYTPRYMQHYHLIIRAVYLLAHARYSVTDISRRLEFSDNANFTRYMKSAIGYTPKDIRKRLELKGIIIE